MGVLKTGNFLPFSKTPGSLLYLDDLYFSNSTQQLPNPGFENWTALSSNEPINWVTSNTFTMPTGNVSVTKASGGYDGNFAIQLENQASLGGDTTSFITNGYIGEGPAGGMPVNYNPDKISFYYQYTPNGPDSALAGGWAWRYDPITDTTLMLEEVMHLLPAATSWTYHEIPFTYNLFPLTDTVTIAFSAGNVETSGAYVGLGSILLVDKVELSLQTIGVNTVVGNNTIRIFPNPASDVIKVEGNMVNAGKVGIYDLCGRLIMEFPLQAGNNLQETNVSQLKSGTYSYQINTGSKLIKGKFVKL